MIAKGLSRVSVSEWGLKLPVLGLLPALCLAVPLSQQAGGAPAPTSEQPGQTQLAPEEIKQTIQRALLISSLEQETSPSEEKIQLKARIQAWSGPEISGLIIETLNEWPDPEDRSLLQTLAEKAAESPSPSDIEKLEKISKSPTPSQDIPRLWASAILEKIAKGEKEKS